MVIDAPLVWHFISVSERIIHYKNIPILAHFQKTPRKLEGDAGNGVSVVAGRVLGCAPFFLAVNEARRNSLHIGAGADKKEENE